MQTASADTSSAGETGSEVSTDGTDSRAHSGKVSESTWAVAIVAATIAATVANRFLVASTAVIPKGPDALGPWAAAFQIAGSDSQITMYDLPPYSVGLGVVLSPLVRLVEDPITRYQIAVFLLGLMPLCAAWCLTRFLRHIYSPSPLGLAAAFATAALAMSVAATASLTWAEPLVLLWMAGWLAIAARAITGPEWQWVLAASAYTGTALLVHGRLILIPVVWLLGLVLSCLLDIRGTRATWRSALARLGEAIVGVVVVFALSRFLQSQVIDATWVDPRSELPGAREKLDQLDYWFWVVRGGLSQLWYLVTSTAGLAVVGLWFLAREFPRIRSTDERRQNSAVVATVALVGLSALIIPGILSMPSALIGPAPRQDHLIYGRYLDPSAVLLAGVGAAALLDMARRVAIRTQVAGIILIGLLGVLVRFNRDSLADKSTTFLEITAAGVSSWPWDRPGLDIIRWSLIGISLAAALLVGRIIDRRAAAAVLMGIGLVGASLGAYAGTVELGRWDNSRLWVGYPEAKPTTNRVLVPKQALGPLAYKFNSPSQQYYLAASGWNFEVVDEDSADLTEQVGEDVGMVVLTSDTPPPEGDWCRMPPYNNLNIWVRMEDVIHGEPGGGCQLVS